MPAHTYPETMPEPGWPGSVYLLCFSGPFKGKRHYLGWAADLEHRLADHFHGNGKSAAYIKAAHAAGIRFACVRWWPGDRHLEAAFKYHSERRQDGRAVQGRHGATRSLAFYCPRCCGRVRMRNPGQTINGTRLPVGWIEPPALF